MQSFPGSGRWWIGGALTALLAVAAGPASAQPESEPESEPEAATVESVSLENLSIGDLAGLVSSASAQARRPQEWSCLGCHETQIDAELWMASLHRNSDEKVTCVDCHPEAARTGDGSVPGLPHPAEVSSQHCGDCHDGMDAIHAGAETTAMGHRPGGANGCAGCHDPHSLAEGISAQAFVAAGCRECHDADEGLADNHSAFFCQAELHLAKVGCMYCHLEGTDSEAVHNVKSGEAANLACDDCHGADSLLGLASALEGDEEQDTGLLKLQNRKLARETGYLIGANRIWGLDLLIILMVLGSFGFPIVHGGLRIFFHWKAK